MHGRAQPRVAQLAQQIKGGRLRSGAAESPAGAERITEKLHLGAQFRLPVRLLGGQHTGPARKGGRQEEEQKKEEALQFGSDNCLSLQR